MLKKGIVIVSIAGVLIGGIAVVDYLWDDIDLYGSAIGVLDKVEGNEYTIKNLGSFSPAKVRGSLKVSDNVPEMNSTSKVLSGDILFTVPTYDTEIRDTFNETIFATDGSFYIAASKNSEAPNMNEQFQLTTRDLGRGAPKIVLARVPNSNITLYIQCYTEKAYTFFTSMQMENLKYERVKLDFSNTTDEIANSIVIDKSLYPKKANMKLEDIYTTIVSKNNIADLEGYSDFIEYKDKYLIYYKAIGFLDTRMKVEYAKLTAMGYTPIEAGTYKDISYIKFNELTVLGKSLTKNSSLIYHVSNLK